MSERADEKRLRLRYAGTCRVCGAALPVHAEAIYERTTRTVRCLHCVRDDGTAEIDIGTPGGSARGEHNRRRERREQRIRSRHPKLGGLILSFTDDPQSTSAWHTGAVGEERLGHRLDELGSETLCLLHDRRIPGTRANIDHLAVTPSGIHVIDAKKYVGRPTLKIEGGIIRKRTERLLVGSRDRSRLVDGVLRQVAVVRDIVPGMPVTGVLCFVGADWPLIGGAFTTRGVEVLWPKKLYKQLTSTGPLEPTTIAEIHRCLAAALPPA